MAGWSDSENQAYEEWKNQVKLTRTMERVWAYQYLIDLDPAAATQRCGLRIRSDQFGLYGNAMLKRQTVKDILAVEIKNREARLQVTADLVLGELMRSLARQVTALHRLQAMLGHDIGELYGPTGALRAVAEWPAVWRQRLVTEIETREFTETEMVDGEFVSKPGEIKKIKRESSLAIEREIRNAEKGINETLELIGKHVDVKAFEQKSGDVHNHLHVHTEIAERLTRAREIAAQSESVIDVNTTAQRD